MIYYIILFIVLIFLAYIMGITIVTLIDKHLGNMVLPEQNIVLNIPEEAFTNQSKYKQNIKENINDNIKENIKENDDDTNDETNNLVEGFDNYDLQNYTLNNSIPTTDLKQTVCFENHNHNKCLYGRMNYPDPQLMSPIDHRYFKYNYQPNLTLQDYANWLWLYTDTEDELPYIHLKNLYKLRKDKKLEYQKDILPPKSKI